MKGYGVKRDLIFSVIFGTLFFVPLVFLLGEEGGGITNFIFFWVASVAALMLMRWFTRLGQKAENVFKEKPAEGEVEPLEGEGATTATAALPEEETYLQMLTGLILVGPYITLALLIVPLAVAAYLGDMIAPQGSMSADGIMGVFLIIASILAAPWLILLQWWGKVRIDLPIIPIPVLFLLPIALIAGIYFAVVG